MCIIMLILFFRTVFENSDEDRDYVASNSSSDKKEQNLIEVGKSRKRVRKVQLWKRILSKLRRNRSQEYVGCKGEIHHAKSVKVYEHKYRYKCT